jgi:ribonucleoside-diphosphate reductase beta chain
MFLPYVSNPELEGCIVTWDFFETIHSRSYTHIIKNVYPDPTEVFDTILNDKEIIKRAKSVTENYDKFGKMALDYAAGKKIDMIDLKKQLYLAMMTVNLLEGLRFYISFACTFAFGELKLMEGSAKILSLIARDESTHLNLSTHVIKAWQKGDDKEMTKAMKGTDKQVIQMFKDCVDEEKAWAKHLFKDGSIIGLNERLLGSYVEWVANKRLRALGFDPLYDIPANQNPLPWTQHWLSSKGMQVAPQETEVESYIVGGIKQDVKKGQFSKFKL